MNRATQLKALSKSLSELVGILRLDESCQWLGHFEASLRETNRLIEKGFGSDQLGDLSGSVMYVYAGAGSFNDYFPATFDSASERFIGIPGTENFEQLSKEVYDHALSLRVIRTGA